MTIQKNCFASDNYAGICPEVWQSMEEANKGFASSYGDDPWTERACERIREVFETDCEVFFVFNGTAANSLALASLCHSYNSIICHESAHVETDECGATEFFSNGTKILLADGENGKISLDSITHIVQKRSDIHYPKPKAISITQSTELGTVYTPDEIRAIGELSKKLDLKLHMDGARFANAVAALDVAPKEITWKAGVDVLCFGGTKNGMAISEAIIFFDKRLATEFDYRCKQAGQLASKMRFLSAPWIGLLGNGAWLKNAAHANSCAALLESRLASIPGISIMFRRDANALFIQMPPELAEGLRAAGWKFYTFIGAGGARFLCSWKTSVEEIEALVSDISRLANQPL